MQELDPAQPAPLITGFSSITPNPSESADPIFSHSEAPKPTVRRLFLGDDGLRAGWSVLLFLVIISILAALLTIGVLHFHPPVKAKPSQPSEGTFSNLLAGEGSGLIVLLLASWLMSRIEGRPFSRYGFRLRRMPADLLLGFFWGLFCLSLLVGTMVLTHALAFDGVLLHGQLALVDGIQWFFGFLLVGLLEEFLFRGYLQYTVARGVSGITRALDPTNRHSFQWGFWVSAFLFSGVFFMFAHLGNSGETFSGILSVGLAGTVFAFSLYRTGSLWWAVGFHTMWDWAQSYLYGVFDSGTMVKGHLLASHPIGPKLLSGAQDGPEASVLCIPMFLVIAAIIHFTLPKRTYPLTPDQSPLPAED